MKLPALNTPIKVDWIDTTTEEGWHYYREGEKPMIPYPRQMSTYGVLVAVSSVAITVTQTISPRADVDATEGHLGYIIIPRGCIFRLKVL